MIWGSSAHVARVRHREWKGSLTCTIKRNLLEARAPGRGITSLSYTYSGAAPSSFGKERSLKCNIKRATVTLLHVQWPFSDATRSRCNHEPQTRTYGALFVAGSGAACGAVASEAAPDLACFAAELRVRRDADC